MKRVIWQALPAPIFGALLLVATACGLGMTHDSYVYEAVAFNLSSGKGLVQADGSAFVLWPPLFPWLLSFVPDMARSGWKWMNLLALGGSLLLWWQMGLAYIRQRSFQLVWGGILSLATPWLVNGKFLWSEPIFILLFSGYVYCLFRFMQGQAKGWLVMATALGFLMPLQRTAAVFVFAGLALGALVFLQPLVVKRRKWLMRHALLSLSGFGGWGYYSWVTHASGGRFYAGDTGFLIKIGQEYLTVLGRWFLPVQAMSGMGWLAGVAVCLALLAVGWEVVQQRQRVLGVLWVMLLVYVALYVLTAFLHGCGEGLEETERFLSVVYPVVFLLLLWAVESLTMKMVKKYRHMTVVLLCACLLYPAFRMVKNTYFFYQRDCGAAATLSLDTLPHLNQRL